MAAFFSGAINKAGNKVLGQMGQKGATKSVALPDGTTLEVPVDRKVRTMSDGSVVVETPGEMPAMYSPTAVSKSRQAENQVIENRYARPDLDPFRTGIEAEYGGVSRTAPTVAATPAYGGAQINTARADAIPIDTRTASYDSGIGRARLGMAAETGAGMAQAEGLGMARGAALGQAPSAAALQLQSGQEQALRSQLALAASARGGAGAQMLAGSNAANQAAQIQSMTNQQAALLRAQEIATARQQYLSGAEEARSQGLTGQQVGLAEAGLGLTQRAQNIDLGTKLREQELGLAERGALLEQEAGLAGANQEYGRAMANAGFQATSQAQMDQYRLGLLGNISNLQNQSRSGTTGYQNAMFGLAESAAERDARQRQIDEQNRIATQNAWIGAGGAALGWLTNFIPKPGGGSGGGSGGGAPTMGSNGLMTPAGW
jgi:hypothetical protein